MGKTKIASFYMIAGSAVNLCLNLLLIPHFGAKGAVIGSIGAELVITILFVRFDDKYMTWKFIALSAYKKIVAGILMLLIIDSLTKVACVSGMGLLLAQIVIGVLSYFAVLTLLKDNTALYISRTVMSLVKRKL